MGKGREAPRGPPDRVTAVSKNLSRILRHSAIEDGLNMDAQGYVQLAELFTHSKMKQHKINFSEICQAVATNDKQRYALQYRANPNDSKSAKNETGSVTESQRALAMAETDQDITKYYIRATQGHSIKSLQAAEMLKPITITNPNSIPETAVHGTFSGLWETILNSGGLRAMNRNHIHLATGPPLSNFINEDGKWIDTANRDAVSDQKAVISGMRRDAQILIYIDIQKALNAGIQFWESENHVVLTEGVAKIDEIKKVLSTEYWHSVIEIKLGLGIIWRQGDGIVQRLPEVLRTKGVPRGKGNDNSGARRKGAPHSGKPKLQVERDDLAGV